MSPPTEVVKAGIPEKSPASQAAGQQGQASAGTPSPTVEGKGEAKADSPTTLEMLGQRFALSSQRRLAALDEAHYFPEKESPAQWTQHLIIQRLHPKEEQGSAGHFLHRLQELLGAKAILLQEGREAALLVYPELKDPVSGVSCDLLCFAFLEGGKAGQLRLFQYLQTHSDTEDPAGSLRFEAWKSSLSQACRRHNFPDSSFAREEHP